MKRVTIQKTFIVGVLATLCCVSLVASAKSNVRSTHQYFESIRDNSVLLRAFLHDFPKGGDLHNHLDGAIYAENYIAWAAADGKCVDLTSYVITAPPCDATRNRPLVKDIVLDGDKVNLLIDAFSLRNYQRRPLSGHDQFFATFIRYLVASFGREGHMIAEATDRAARQNVLYLELMQSYGMHPARELGRQDTLFNTTGALEQLARHEGLEKVVQDTIEFTDRAEREWREVLKCGTQNAAPGCNIEVRYLAQVIRTFPRPQVLAQTLLAFKLIERDPRYVGLNFVAPEDHPVTLRDYRWQMEIIAAIAKLYPGTEQGIALHAGELTLGLVPPEALRSHINDAVRVAGARRIGHGIDIVYEDDFEQLLEHMAQQQIAVEINLTSNADILGVEGDEHPFPLYRQYSVPLVLSTDDEGVSRIDLTHEYQRAVQTFKLSYGDLKALSRNALSYSFLAGESLYSDNTRGRRSAACAKNNPATPDRSDACQRFLDSSEKARLQWRLEQAFLNFEAKFPG